LHIHVFTHDVPSLSPDWSLLMLTSWLSAAYRPLWFVFCLLCMWTKQHVWCGMVFIHLCLEYWMELSRAGLLALLCFVCTLISFCLAWEIRELDVGLVNFLLVRLPMLMILYYWPLVPVLWGQCYQCVISSEVSIVWNLMQQNLKACSLPHGVGLSGIFRTDFTDLNLYCIKAALALVVLVSFSGYVC